MKKKFLIPIIIIVLILAFFSTTIIPTGYVGVRTTFGQIDPNPVSTGFNFKLPFIQSIKTVNTKQSDIVFEDEIWSESSERTAICFSNITVTYSINPDRAAWIVANVNDYKKTLINNNIVSSALKSASKQLDSTDVTNRSKIEPLAQQTLQQSMDGKYGTETITIHKITIEGADFEEDYNQAIADKQKAQMAYEKAQIENKKAIEKAESDAEVKLKAAQADAEAKKIAAEAEAEANKKISASLTEEVLQDKYYSKWNGELPKVTGSNALVNIPVE